jgi:hypothetical protein
MRGPKSLGQVSSVYRTVCMIVAVAQEVLQRAGIDPVIGFFAEAWICCRCWIVSAMPDNETELFTARMDALVLRPHRRLGPLSGYRSFDALQIGVDGR